MNRTQKLEFFTTKQLGLILTRRWRAGVLRSSTRGFARAEEPLGTRWTGLDAQKRSRPKYRPEAARVCVDAECVGERGSADSARTYDATQGFVGLRPVTPEAAGSSPDLSSKSRV